MAKHLQQLPRLRLQTIAEVYSKHGMAISNPGFLELVCRRANMLWTIFVILLVLWLLGFSFHVAGGLIHLLLVVAVVVLLINLLSGRRTAV